MALTGKLVGTFVRQIRSCGKDLLFGESFSELIVRDSLRREDEDINVSGKGCQELNTTLILHLNS